MAYSSVALSRGADSLMAWADAQGGRVVSLAEVDSTSDYLRAYWPTFQRDGAAWAVCLADRQTAGRGRQGHAWLSAPGAGLWCSLAVPVAHRADMAGDATPPLSLVLAAALIDVLRDAGFPVMLKWPNDLWLSERKVGGLLIEQLGVSRARYWLAGIGINWQAPAALPPDKTGGSVEAAGLFDALPAMGVLPNDSTDLRAELTDRLCRRALETIRAPDCWSDWMCRADTYSVLSGRRVQVWQDGSPQSSGLAERIEPDGTLMINTDAGATRVGGSASVRLLI